ncbi:CCA tRNA nucleotidyltransferase [bacterium]|nr:CCA tRNA nucleotidyltransferase [candidate division CSSED10-310 bacterium]
MRFSEEVRTHLAVMAGMAGGPLYVVGGAVRNLLLGIPVEDVDLVVPTGAVALARRVARRIRGAFVLLDEKEDMARVVRHRRLIYDFAGFRAGDLVSDLGKRDFTINAMAARVDESGSIAGDLVDPCGGRRDLAERVIRVVSPAAYDDDPLRLLRTFRFAAAMGSVVEPRTMALAASEAGKIATVAGERIHYELLRMLDTGDGAAGLRGAEECGLLEVLLPGWRERHGDAAGTEPVAIRRVAAAENSIRCGDALYRAVCGGESPVESTDLKLALLLRDIVSGAAVSADSGTTPRQVLRRLNCSNRERAVITGIAAAMTPVETVFDRIGILPGIREIYDMYLAAKDLLPLVLFAVGVERVVRGDCEAVGDDVFPDYAGNVLRAVRETIVPRLRAEWLPSGTDLITIGIAPGPILGELLAGIRRAAVEGRVDDRLSCLDLARSLARREAGDSSDSE